MKKVRFLVAMMLVVAALTVGVMAANEDYIKFETDTIECDGTNAITVNVVSPTGFSNGMVFFGIEFDNTKWDVTTSNTKAAVVGNMINYIDDAGSAEVGAKGTILSFTATPKSTDVASTFELKEGQIVCLDPEAILADAATATLTVTAAQQAKAPTYTSVIDNNKTLQGAEFAYQGVWTGDYTIALNGNAISKATVNFAYTDGGESKTTGYEKFACALDDTDGDGSVAFKIAILGVPSDAVDTPAIYGTDWVDAVKAN